MLIDTLKKENMLALKDKDTNKRAVLSVVINKYMIAGYEAKAQGKEIGDVELVQIINKTLKELEEEKEGYISASRMEEVKNIDNQIKVLNIYLPKMMSEEEIKKIINTLDDKSIPNVMKHFKINYAGKVDMSLVSKVLRSLNS
jgi:Uncharacterized conserved protein